jgi:hypothetical protein
MAVKAYSVQTSPNPLNNSRVVTWALANGDTGVPYEGANFLDHYGTVTGTFGVAGSVQFEGSNDLVAWTILKNPQGTAVTKTSAGGDMIQESPRYIRPNCTAGDGTTALSAVLFERAINR